MGKTPWGKRDGLGEMSRGMRHGGTSRNRQEGVE